jgi:hypothetical protein
MVDIVITAGIMVIDDIMGIIMATVTIIETGTVIIAEIMATAITVIATTAIATTAIATIATAITVIETMVIEDIMGIGNIDIYLSWS